MVMHALADLENPFQKYFLKIVDGDDVTPIDIYRINMSFIDSLSKYWYEVQSKPSLNSLHQLHLGAKLTILS